MPTIKYNLEQRITMAVDCIIFEFNLDEVPELILDPEQIVQDPIRKPRRFPYVQKFSASTFYAPVSSVFDGVDCFSLK